MVPTQTLDLVGNEDDKGNVAEDIGADDYKHGEQHGASELLNVHKVGHLVEGDGGEAGVLEATQPDKEPHEHEDDSPVNLEHGIVGILLVEDGVHEHSEDGGTHGDETEVELGRNHWWGRDGEEDHHQSSDESQPCCK